MGFSDLMIFLKALEQKEKDDYKQLLSVAHKTALWTRCDPKKFPTLAEVFEEIDKTSIKAENKKQTPEQMLEMVKSLHMKFGGA
jgi:hypothetical protein